MAVFLITLGALTLFILGLSITLMRKGHNIEGDVGDNRHMKSLGLQCTMKQFTDGEVECHSGGRYSAQNSSKLNVNSCTDDNCSDCSRN